LSLAYAQLSITADKRAKVLNFLDETLSQVKLGVWDVALSDTTVGKLSAIALVVPGGRAALAPMYRARVATASRWPDPRGKLPKGAKCRATGSNPHVAECLWKSCVYGLSFWKERLIRDAPPVLPLFQFKDGSLAIWGPDIFPVYEPFRLPAPAPHM
jgi:hypothetical protein